MVRIQFSPVSPPRPLGHSTVHFVPRFRLPSTQTITNAQDDRNRHLNPELTRSFHNKNGNNETVRTYGKRQNRQFDVSRLSWGNSTLFSVRYPESSSRPASAATFGRYVRECVESRQEPTTAGLLRLAKQQAVKDTILPETHSCNRFVRDLHKLVAEGRWFSTIYADPPWKYSNQGTRAATDNYYPTLPFEQIAAEPVAELAADNCHLHLWTTNGFLPVAFTVIEAWGFSYRSCFVWVKPQLGLGNWWRCSHELLLFATRGNLPFRDRGQRSWIELDRQGHSRKPEEIRALVEKVSPPEYLELYGRVVPDKSAWTVYGNQLNDDS
ncbi:MAG: hypothetical protein IT427_16265 [Pirellulales bacterium]|nr:hypothetical protein [Pirellulales bacterium]